ncbi:MAG: 50S ribosomal protein P1 [Candidatus Hecatellaceae archaeon]|nr:MAG: 50S ribosomal protein P1 [Candidatus Hecatellales archaeon]
MSTAYVHAALLLHFAGQPVNEENLKKVLEAAGLSPDEARVKVLTAALSEVNIEEAIKTAPTLAAPVAAPAAPAAEAKPAEEKKKAEEKKEEEEEKKEEEALSGLGALFG